MTPPVMTTEALMDALSNDWQPITTLIFKMQIKEMMDARFLQIKLKELERKGLILVETKMGKKHYKVEKPDLIITHEYLDTAVKQSDSLNDDYIIYSEATLELEKIVDLDPFDEKTWLELGQEYFKQGDYAWAIKSYKNAIILYDDDDLEFKIKSLNNLGSAYHKNGEVHLAMDSYENALKLTEEYTFIYLKKFLLRDIGNIFSEEDNHQEAIMYYEKALELSILEESSPFHQEVLFSLGMSYSNIKQPEKAIVCFEKIAKHDPELDIIWSALGLAYSANKEYDKAVECFEIALQFNPSDEDIIEKLNFVVDEMKKNEHLEESPQELPEESKDSVFSKDDILSFLKELSVQFEKLVKLTELTTAIHIKSFINDQIKPFFENPSKKKIKKLKKSIEHHIEFWPEDKREEFFNEYSRTIKRYEELQPPKWKIYGKGLLKLIPLLR